MGTAIQEPGGKLYAITIPVPTVRFKRNKRQLQDALLRCRAEIVEEIEK